MNLSVQTVEKDTWQGVVTAKWKKIRVINLMQTNSRVGRRRALKILAGEDESPKTNPIP